MRRARGHALAGFHDIVECDHEGFAARELRSPHGLAARFLPGAGMLGASLRHRGEELLGQRRGLAAYVEHGATLGIPLLHPWANRLRRWGYRWGGMEVTLPRDAPLVRADRDTGLPIHGLLAGCPDWRVVAASADRHAARLAAELDFSADPARAALFPFPHLLRVDVELAGQRLSISTTLRATGERAVPVAFGWHPYLRLPGVAREAWELAAPVRRRRVLDDRCLPTGATEPVALPPAPLCERTFDDLFDALDPEGRFVLSGGGRRVEVGFGAGYPVAVIYAPAGDDVVCFEPMTAPTDPFEGGFEGGASLRSVARGEAFAARFTIEVHDERGGPPA